MAMSKFSLSIIPRKFNKKVSVADIKQYLVDEFDNSKKLQNNIYVLQDELKKSKEYEAKYELSLITLDEYKSRMKSTVDRNKQLEEQIKVFQNTIKEKTYEISNLKLENRKMEHHIKNIEKDIKKNIIKEFKEKANNLKGHIKKDDVMKLFRL